MNKKLVLSAAMAALLSVASGLVAASADRAERAFAKADKNGDGKISKEEFAAIGSGKTDKSKADKVFARRDKNGDGSLSKEEFAAASADKKKDGDSGTTEKKRKKDK